MVDEICLLEPVFEEMILLKKIFHQKSFDRNFWFTPISEEKIFQP
jgi:hypothetical protein